MTVLAARPARTAAPRAFTWSRSSARSSLLVIQTGAVFRT